MSFEGNALTELECVICNDYLYPPIKMCMSGHSICPMCFEMVTSCPICGAPMGTCRNFAVEAIISQMKAPCTYKVLGCRTVQVIATIRQHEEFCEHRVAKCPLSESSNCKWTGKPEYFITHARESHAQHQPALNNSVVHLEDFPRDGKYYQLVDACDKVFKYCININLCKNVVEWCVQFIGPPEDACNYSYVITCIDRNEGTEQDAVTSVCQAILPDNLAFTEGNGCSIPVDKLQKFCGGDECLYFHFEIVLTKDLVNNQ